MITVIKNGTVITMDQKRKNKYEQLDIVIENDKIKEITKEYKGKYDKIINANNKIEALIKGEDVEMHEVMLAMQESSLSLQALIEVRNKAVEAYQEISKLQL